MMGAVTADLHPERALFDGERPVPVIAACDHYAGTELFRRRALQLQGARGPGCDGTLALGDGAPAGREREHAGLVVALLTGPENRWSAAGVRLHDGGSAHFATDLDAIVRGAGERVA